MTDIVDQLKDCHTEWIMGDTRRWSRGDMVAMLPEAVAEIEQLRRENRELLRQRDELIVLVAEQAAALAAAMKDAKPC